MKHESTARASQNSEHDHTQHIPRSRATHLPGEPEYHADDHGTQARGSPVQEPRKVQSQQAPRDDHHNGGTSNRRRREACRASAWVGKRAWALLFCVTEAGGGGEENATAFGKKQLTAEGGESPMRTRCSQDPPQGRHPTQRSLPLRPAFVVRHSMEGSEQTPAPSLRRIMADAQSARVSGGVSRTLISGT